MYSVYLLDDFNWVNRVQGTLSTTNITFLICRQELGYLFISWYWMHALKATCTLK